MPNRAAAKLKMRLRNQRELIQTDDARGSNDACGGEGDAGDVLEFEICKETLSRVCAIWSRV